MLKTPTIVLNDGAVIPQLGLGVWQIAPDRTVEIVGEALAAGYRHIDTAQGYENEVAVGEAIRRSGVPRNEIFVTSKLRTRAMGYDKALAEFEVTLDRLGVETLDLFLIHWPMPMLDLYVETWQALIRLRGEGRVRSIGVSNFLPEHLDRIFGETGVAPSVNQVELHPYFQQRDLRDPARARGVHLESYSPLGSGEVLGDATIGEIAKKHGRSSAQVIIRWHLQQDLIVIPKSAHAERVRENMAVFDFSLDGDDMARIARLDRLGGKLLDDPLTMDELY